MYDRSPSGVACRRGDHGNIDRSTHGGEGVASDAGDVGDASDDAARNDAEEPDGTASLEGRVDMRFLDGRVGPGERVRHCTATGPSFLIFGSIHHVRQGTFIPMRAV